jgi:class 3 adenylate cyclase
MRRSADGGEVVPVSAPVARPSPLAGDHAAGTQDESEVAARLRLSAWGLRFALPDAEAEYRLWQTQQALPFTRMGMLASILAWLGMFVAIGLAGKRYTAEVSFGIALVLTAIGAAIATTYAERLHRWVHVATALANTIAGVVLVRVCTTVVGLAEGAATAAIVVSFFGFAVFRVQTPLALVAVLPYVALAQVELVGGLRAAAVPMVGFLAYSFGMWLAFVSGLVACATSDREMRGAFRQERILDAQRRSTERERRRADELLRSILPAEIAEELKVHLRDPSPHRIASYFHEVTVVFADIVGFTPLAARLPPGDVVALLNDLFTRFDSAVAELGVEKIKTIGDAYMASAGLPTPRSDHAVAAAELALAMKDAVEEFSRSHETQISIRIGLCTGPVVAGVIGSRKFAYDLWGDTVNLAARMESQGVPGEIQVAPSTFRALAGQYSFRQRGIVEVKGRGNVETWFLCGRV